MAMTKRYKLGRTARNMIKSMLNVQEIRLRDDLEEGHVWEESEDLHQWEKGRPLTFNELVMIQSLVAKWKADGLMEISIKYSADQFFSLLPKLGIEFAKRPERGYVIPAHKDKESVLELYRAHIAPHEPVIVQTQYGTAIFTDDSEWAKKIEL
jgi:hypothetical protein